MMKRVYIVLLILTFSLMGLFIYDNFKLKEFSHQFEFNNDTVIVSIYTNNSKKADKIVKKIEKIYIKYQKLTDTIKSYDGINNLYSIRHNYNKNTYLDIDKDLYTLLKYGINIYDKTNGKIDISMGNILDLWNSYNLTKLRTPSIEEIKIANNQKITDIDLKENKILNNHININLDYIIKGYIMKEIKTYLKENNIDNYYINADKEVLVGGNKPYKVALQDPNDENSIYQIIKVNNSYISTSSGDVIDSKTLSLANNMKSVTVITSNDEYATYLSKLLYLMPVEEGIEYINKLDNVEAIWYKNDDTIVTSKGLKKYK